jgi:uncharacterized membrane protein YgaE (UPF0421/DUF939 family)
MKLINYILINKEARLFDTKEFLLKTFIAVLIGYVVGMKIPFLSRDMISLLFGMMLTIEPVNMTGIKSGLKQVEATIVGAMITGIILALFGYNPWTAAMAVTATLYVSLVIDWRSFSVVAVFTSIYMTQYVQLDALGQPSEIETFKLRMAALLTGVAIAFIVNFIFSLLGYKHMLEKRVYHLLDSLSFKMEAISMMVHQQRFEDASELMTNFTDLLNNTRWIVTTIHDFKRDPIVKRGAKNRDRLEKISKMTDLIREMNHLSYDMCYRITKNDPFSQADGFATSFRETITSLSLLKEKLNGIIRNQAIASTVKPLKSVALDPTLRQLDDNIAVLDDLLSQY